MLETNFGKFSITQAPYAYSPPLFDQVYDSGQKFQAYPQDGVFYVSHEGPGGPGMKYNEETKEWEPDMENLCPGMQLFNLIIKKIED